MNTIPASNRGIKKAIKTYDEVEGAMIHDGYFLILKEVPLKWVSKWQYEHLLSLTPLQRVDVAYKFNNVKELL